MSADSNGAQGKRNHQNDLIMEIGSLLLSDSELAAMPWQSVALVTTMTDGAKQMTGYRYFDDDDFSPWIPDTLDSLDKIIELPECMGEYEGHSWHQCLVHITKPDLKINIQFEYDDPDRWKPKTISLDMSEFANLLKPGFG